MAAAEYGPSRTGRKDDLGPRLLSYQARGLVVTEIIDIAKFGDERLSSARQRNLIASRKLLLLGRAICAAKQSGAISMKNIILSGLAISALALATFPTAAMSAEPGMMGTTSMGQAWVDAKGMTLYSFDKDTAVKSNCIDKCALEWPPLKAVKGSKPMGKWTVVARADGSDMWAYEGHPLYTFVKDLKPGQVAGDNMDGFHIVK
jgi:predicted lipoprotein with Yx(FWY)xxD motif